MDGEDLFANSNGILANYLYVIYTSGFTSAVGDLDAGPHRRVPLHGVPDRAGFSGFVHRLSHRTGARTPLFAGSRATSATPGALVLQLDAGHTQPAGACSLRLLSERSY